MTAYISTNCAGDEWRWSVVRTTPSGADVVVRGHHGYLDEATCRRDADRLARMLREALVAQSPDGSWRWFCRDADGAVVLESERFADAATCGHDLASVRLETRGAIAPAKIIARDREADLVLDD